VWCSNSKTWREKARAELAAVCKPGEDGVRTLNKSQIAAIAQSLCQTCTLWQVGRACSAVHSSLEAL